MLLDKDCPSNFGTCCGSLPCFKKNMTYSCSMCFFPEILVASFGFWFDFLFEIACFGQARPCLADFGWFFQRFRWVPRPVWNTSGRVWRFFCFVDSGDFGWVFI